MQQAMYGTQRATAGALVAGECIERTLRDPRYLFRSESEQQRAASEEWYGKNKDFPDGSQKPASKTSLAIIRMEYNAVPMMPSTRLVVPHALAVRAFRMASS